MIFLKAITCIKCTDCGLMQPKNGNLKDMGVLEGNNCSNCGGEIVIVDVHFVDHID